MRPIHRFVVPFVIGTALVIAPPPPAQALTIVTEFVGAGGTFNLTAAGSPATAIGEPANSTGGGNLQTVFNAAARYWEGLFPGTGDTLEVDFGFADLSGGTLGSATQFTTRNFSDPNVAEQSVGTIRFDASNRTWFIDSTPEDTSEFGAQITTTADLGGGEITTGRAFQANTADSIGEFDLLTVAIHEIGHLLGLANLEDSDPFPGSIIIDDTITTPFAVAGTEIPLTAVGGGHISSSDPIFSDAVLIPTINAGERRLASDAGILATAQISGFGVAALDQAGTITLIPLPTPFLLFASALVGLGFSVRRR